MSLPPLSPAHDALRRFAAAWADEALPGCPVIDPFAAIERPAPAEVREAAAAGVALEPGTAALLLLDPCAAGDFPLPLVLGWLEGESVDLLLRFPTADLRRFAQHRGCALADLPPQLKRTVEGLSRFLGDTRHQWLLRWTAALAEGVEGAIEAIVTDYAARLSRDRPLRQLRLPGAEGTEHLLLLSARPATLLLLNPVVHGLREDGLLPWPESDAGAVRYPLASELALFAESGAPARRERVLDRQGLADSLAVRFAGRSAPLEEVLHSLVGTDLFAGEVRRALLDLRRDGRAEFRSLATEITFAGPGARAMHHRPARKRAAARQELSLALD